MNKSKLLVVTLFFILGLFTLSFSQEQITITTYYPSPYGSYNELQLFPHNPAVTNCNTANAQGTLYYDSITRSVQVCTFDGTSYFWTAIGGGGAAPAPSTAIYINWQLNIPTGTTVPCDAGDLMTGGGASIATGQYIRASFPSGIDRWSCDADSGVPISCYVICLDFPPAH